MIIFLLFFLGLMVGLLSSLSMFLVIYFFHGLSLHVFSSFYFLFFILLHCKIGFLDLYNLLYVVMSLFILCIYFELALVSRVGSKNFYTILLLVSLLLYYGVAINLMSYPFKFS